MNFTDIGEKVKEYAPLLGKALALSAPITGPAGPIAGGLISAVAGMFGVDPDAAAKDPAKLAAAIGADPEAAVKLREIESRERVEIQRLLIQQEQAYLADRQSARQREIATTRATGERDLSLYALAWVVALCFFGLVGMMYFIDLPEANIGPLNQLLGAVATGFGMVLSYFFGTSKGEKDKDRRGAGK